MEQEHKKKTLTMQELMALINDTEGDFFISIPLGEEADLNAEKE